ncbi:hypothetical protein [Flavobacterium sp. MK4S-17]|uniref:hypothetical protein n=1 Tax=Flavobacterium sp. MK4S-17 TaxID=2543737 RepID=UPI00135AA33F|nr:hypothetical protein [Flavobacterium sp. MK4S-17]
MENENKNNGNENPAKLSTHRTDNSGSDWLNEKRPDSGNSKEGFEKENGIAEDTDKYLAMEQPGVTYTNDDDTVRLSDSDNFDENRGNEKWNREGDNSEYSDAFNQDDYILQDNVDLDEDQNQSLSSDDDDFEETNERY